MGLDVRLEIARYLHGELGGERFRPPELLERMVEEVGSETAEELRRRSMDIFERGSKYAAERGIIIADTKFEWGRTADGFILIDEVLTPDSSRFWPADQYAAGKSQPSFDKQFVRDWLLQSDWDRRSPPPPLPPETIAVGPWRKSWAPMRESSATWRKRSGKIFSVITLVPSASVSRAMNCACRSVGKPGYGWVVISAGRMGPVGRMWMGEWEMGDG